MQRTSPTVDGTVWIVEQSEKAALIINKQSMETIRIKEILSFSKFLKLFRTTDFQQRHPMRRQYNLEIQLAVAACLQHVIPRLSLDLAEFLIALYL